MALSELTEATPDTSADEIKQYAESVVQEIVQERQGEGKSDAQITNEQSGTPQPGDKTLAEENSSEQTAPEGEDTGDDTERPEWMTDDVKAEAAAYGIEESELADFASREELDRALRLFDKTALEAGRKAMAEGEETPVRNEKGQFVKKEEPKADNESSETGDKSGRFEVTLDRDVYDEEIVNHITGMRDYVSSLEARLVEAERRFAEADAIAEEQRFDNYVDTLGHSDLFGTTGKESAKELERRKALHDEVNTRVLGLERLGRPTKISETLVRLAARTVFAEELEKKKLKQQTSKVSKQNQLRQGGSPTKPTPPRDNPRDEADRLYRELASS